MLIVYRTATGEVADNTGTNSRNPLGPPDERAYVNTDRRGIDRADLSLLRLHDVEDAELVGQVLTHQVTVVDGQVVVGDPYPEPDPVEPEPDPRDVKLAEHDVAIAGVMNLLGQFLGGGA